MDENDAPEQTTLMLEDGEVSDGEDDRLQCVLNFHDGDNDEGVLMMSEVHEILSMLEGLVSLLDNIEENEVLELGNDDTLKAAADQYQDQLVLVSEKSQKPGCY